MIRSNFPISVRQPFCASTSRRRWLSTTRAAIDPEGGFFHYFMDDGTIYDRSHRHLVSSTRFVFNYAMARDRVRSADDYRDAARHGLRYLREVHRDAATGGYAWTIRDGQPDDRTNSRLRHGLCAARLRHRAARPASAEAAAVDGRNLAIAGSNASGMPTAGPLSRRSRCGLEVFSATADRTPTCICARRCWRRTRPAARPALSGSRADACRRT